MRCYICDVELTENEIQLVEDETGLERSEPCTTCWNIIIDTAYSSGFQPGGDKSTGDALLEIEVDEEEGVLENVTL